jgi:hypothetical protein
MLTIKEVKEGATTPKKALELSIKHWWENYTLPKRELQRELQGDPGAISDELCGLCEYWKGCGSCPVRPDCFENSSFHKQTKKAYHMFEQSHSEENYQAWRKAAKSMHKYLCSLRTKI